MVLHMKACGMIYCGGIDARYHGDRSRRASVERPGEKKRKKTGTGEIYEAGRVCGRQAGRGAAHK